MLVNALSIDVEDFFHVTSFEKYIPPSEWDQITPRVKDNTLRILDILDKSKVNATFFVLGWVAERYPELVEAIAKKGHEIGSHSFSHKRIYMQTPDEFRKDLKKSLDIIARITGSAPKLFRAPSFSIIKETLWALEIIQEEGITHDSSIFPIKHDVYGYENIPVYPHQIREGLWEFPLPAMRIAGQNLPVGGGGYLRLYPYWITRWALRKINALGRPFIVYLHPWEIDPDQPRFNLRGKSRFRHYQNLEKTETRLCNLLRDFKFAPIQEVLNSWKSKNNAG